MSVPVLVIHGVANRDQVAFYTEVANLQNRIGADYQLIPVWWADLGAQTDYLSDTLPDMGAVGVRAEGAPVVDRDVLEELLRAATTAQMPSRVRATGEAAELVIRAARGSLGRSG